MNELVRIRSGVRPHLHQLMERTGFNRSQIVHMALAKLQAEDIPTDHRELAALLNFGLDPDANVGD